MKAAGAAVGGLALVLVALTFGATPLLVPGLAFMLIAAVATLWAWSAARGASLRRLPLPRRVLEGDVVPVGCEIRFGPLGLPSAELHDPLAQGRLSVARRPGPAVLRRVEISLELRFPRRGRYQLKPPRLLLSDPLGLAKATVPAAESTQEVLVLPRTESVRWIRAGLAASGEGAGTQAGEALASVDVEGLRPYRAGTPASRIHWSALARGGPLLERHLRGDTGAQALVVLDARGEDPDHLDAAVRATASLVLELIRHGGCRVLLPGDPRPVTVERAGARWAAVHARLAVVQGGPAAHRPALGAARRAGPLFWVAAQTPSAGEGLSGAGGRETVLLLPETVPPPAETPACLSVSGCKGMWLGHSPGRMPARALSRERVA